MPWTWETPTRVRFKTLLEEGYSQRQAAQNLGIPWSSARYWIDKPDRQSKPPGASSIILNDKIKEIVDWFTGHYDRRIYTMNIGKSGARPVHIICAQRAQGAHGPTAHTDPCTNSPWSLRALCANYYFSELYVQNRISLRAPQCTFLCTNFYLAEHAPRSFSTNSARSVALWPPSTNSACSTAFLYEFCAVCGSIQILCGLRPCFIILQGPLFLFIYLFTSVFLSARQ